MHRVSANVSVVVPTYNRAASIGECVESILAQSVPPREVIVVDDGSSDETPAVLSRFGASITVVRQANVGASAARNAGIVKSKGDWVAFLDSDDVWRRDRIAVLKRDIDDAPVSVGVHAANILMSGASRQFELFAARKFNLPRGSARLIERPLRYAATSFNSPGAAVRRDWLVRVGGFPVHMPFFEDTFLFCRLSQLGPWLMTADIVTEARRMPGTESGLSERASQDLIYLTRLKAHAYRELLGTGEFGASDRKILRRRQSAALFTLARRLQLAGDDMAARLALGESIRAHPNWVGWIKALPPRVIGARGYGVSLRLGQAIRGR